MPLRAGHSLATARGNIAEIMRSYKRKGTIGTSTPKNKKKAVKQAVAIAMHKAGISRKERKRARKRRRSAA